MGVNTPRTPGRILAIALSAVLGLSSASAADIAGARAFVVWLFSHYPRRDNSRFDPLGRSGAAVFDPSVIALFRENDRLTPKGDEGALDGDPICDCQDDSGLLVRRMTVTPADALDATASVEFVLAGGDRRSERLDLVLIGGHWRIRDIHTKDMPSLRSYLIEANRAARTGRR